MQRDGARIRAAVLGALLVLALAGCAIGGRPAPRPSASASAPVSAERTDGLQVRPFAADSPANRPLAAGTTFEAQDGPMTAALHGAGAIDVNSSAWSFAFYRTTTKDPLVTVRSPDHWSAVVQMRLPVDATTTAGTDDHMGVVQPDGHTAYELYKMHHRSDGTWTSPYVIKTDLRGTGADGGARASGTSIFWGVVLASDLASGRIDHTLAMGVPNSVLQAGEVWPARLQDSDAATAYTGVVPMGTLFAIPPSVDIARLGLSAEGLVLARALQQYGAYVMIRSSSVALYAEKAADPSQVSALRAPWRQLRPLLRAVTDNHQ